MNFSSGQTTVRNKLASIEQVPLYFYHNSSSLATILNYQVNNCFYHKLHPQNEFLAPRLVCISNVVIVGV